MSRLTELERARLRWRARRGLLENDLIITRYLDAYEAELTDDDVVAGGAAEHDQVPVSYTHLTLPTIYSV